MQQNKKYDFFLKFHNSLSLELLLNIKFDALPTQNNSR